MATSKCPKCGNNTFLVEKLMPENDGQEIKVLYCSNCHTIIGPICFSRAVDNIDSIKTKIEDIEEKDNNTSCM